MIRNAVLLVFAFTLAGELSADILYLRDGARYSGELVSENSHEVVFRVRSPDGRGAFLRKVPRELVERVVRGAVEPPAAGPPPSASAESEPADAGQGAPRLDAALELLDRGDVRAALRRMQALVQDSSAPQLAELDAHCRARRGVAFDQTLAAARLRVAESEVGGRGFRLVYATPFERPALGRLLADAQEQRLRQVYSGRTVAWWAASPDEYPGLNADTPQLVDDAARAVALIATRLKLDPALKDARAERMRLDALQTDLRRLTARLSALPGFTVAASQPSGPDPTETAAFELERRGAAPQTASAPAASQPASAPASRPTEDEPLGILPR